MANNPEQNHRIPMNEPPLLAGDIQPNNIELNNREPNIGQVNEQIIIDNKPELLNALKDLLENYKQPIEPDCITHNPPVNNPMEGEHVNTQDIPQQQFMEEQPHNQPQYHNNQPQQNMNNNQFQHQQNINNQFQQQQQHRGAYPYNNQYRGNNGYQQPPQYNYVNPGPSAAQQITTLLFKTWALIWSFCSWVCSLSLGYGIAVVIFIIIIAYCIRFFNKYIRGDNSYYEEEEYSDGEGEEEEESG